MKTGKNLLAFHVRYYKGIEDYEEERFFDFELMFQERSLEEAVFDFVRGRLNPDGDFSDNCIGHTFCATSILEAFDNIDALDKERVALWVLSRKSVYGHFDFNEFEVGEQYFAIEALKNLGSRLDNEGSERLANRIIEERRADGSWHELFHEDDLTVTWEAIEILTSLNSLNRIKDWGKTINWIKSRQGKDGGFSDEPGETSSLWHTFHAIRSPQLLNALDSIDKDKAIKFIKLCYRDGGFAGRPEEEWEVYSTHEGVKSLKILNALNEVGPEATAKKVIFLLGDKWSTGDPYG